MRLINADALEPDADYDDGDYWAVSVAQITNAPTIEPERTGKWIPVSERLPEDGNWCLFTDGVSMSVERYKADSLDHFFPEGRWFGLKDAVAWMPLPEPYREGVNNDG